MSNASRSAGAKWAGGWLIAPHGHVRTSRPSDAITGLTVIFAVKSNSTGNGIEPHCLRTGFSTTQIVSGAYNVSRPLCAISEIELPSVFRLPRVAVILGDVRRPDLIRCRRCEVSVEQIVGGQQPVLRVCRDLVAPLVAGMDQALGGAWLRGYFFRQSLMKAFRSSPFLPAASWLQAFIFSRCAFCLFFRQSLMNALRSGPFLSPAS